MKTDQNSRHFFIAAVLFALTLACLFPLNARAEYPERPVTMDVAFAPGGSMDMASRAMAAAAEKHLGKSILWKTREEGAERSRWRSWQMQSLTDTRSVPAQAPG